MSNAKKVILNFISKVTQNTNLMQRFKNNNENTLTYYMKLL